MFIVYDFSDHKFFYSKDEHANDTAALDVM